MKKLALNLEELHVESFATSPGERDDRGTIQGRVMGAGTENTCQAQITCDPTCWNTCPDTCGGTCMDLTCQFTCGGATDCATHGYTCGDTCDDTCYCTLVVGQYGCTTTQGTTGGSWRC